MPIFAWSHPTRMGNPPLARLTATRLFLCHSRSHVTEGTHVTQSEAKSHFCHPERSEGSPSLSPRAKRRVSIFVFRDEPAFVSNSPAKACSGLGYWLRQSPAAKVPYRTSLAR